MIEHGKEKRSHTQKIDYHCEAMQLPKHVETWKIECRLAKPVDASVANYVPDRTIFRP